MHTHVQRHECARLSDEGIGFEDTMKNLELRLEAKFRTCCLRFRVSP